MTSQQLADRDLQVWQANRELPPSERMAKLFGDFWAEPPSLMTEFEFDLILNRVQEAMHA